MATSQSSAALITIAALGTTLLIGTGCSYSPDAGLGPVPVQDAWAGCIDIADGQGTELSTIVDAPTDTPTRLPGYAESAAWYRNDEYVSLGGRRYARFGRLRRLDPDGFAARGREMVRVGEQGGVPLYAEGPDPEPPTVLWVPLRPGCLFQSYQRSHNDRPRDWEGPPPASALDLTAAVQAGVVAHSGLTYVLPLHICTGVIPVMRTRLSHLVTLATATALFAAGCKDANTPATVAVPAAPSMSEAVGPDRSSRFRLGEEHSVALAREVPGFGGFYLDDSGNLHAFLTDLKQSDSVRASLARVLANRQRDYTETERQMRTRSEIVIHQAQFTFLQLADWRNQLEDPIMRIPGVVWIGLDEHINRVAVGVDRTRSAAVEALVAQTLVELRIPREVVSTELADPISVQS